MSKAAKNSKPHKVVAYTEEGVKILDDNYQGKYLVVGEVNDANLRYAESKFFRLMLDLMRLAQWEPIHPFNCPLEACDNPYDRWQFSKAMIDFTEARYP
ncbi:MAG: hypothetical protein IJG80_09430 [Selenomonadaceae bacterium]|nr:hypothetical protein [Selenomonadaceae bacterium]MBQ3433723.1 hypothetical protein [Selenomonadaceae bacterium]